MSTSSVPTSPRWSHSQSIFLGVAVLLYCPFLLGMTAVAAQKPKGKIADQIKVIQKPMTIRNCFYETDLPASLQVQVRPRSNTGRTDWHFPCLCKFQFEVEKDANDQISHQVSIKVTSITVNINLPVIVWRSNQLHGKSKDEIERHEGGHVEIVRRIYTHAGEAAREAAMTVIGKRFSGSGKTKELAISSAILGAREAVCAPYRVKTAYAADVISSSYDRIERRIERASDTETTKDNVDQAFKEFKAAGHQL